MTADRPLGPGPDRLPAVPGERARQLAAPSDPELGEDPVQVGADRPMGQEESLSDLAVGHPLGGQLRDLGLLRRQTIAWLRRRTPAALPGGAELTVGPVGPPRRAQGIEG